MGRYKCRQRVDTRSTEKKVMAAIGLGLVFLIGGEMTGMILLGLVVLVAIDLGVWFAKRQALKEQTGQVYTWKQL